GWGVTGPVRRQQHYRHRRQLVDEPGEEFLRCLVDPVQILNQHDHRTATGLCHQQSAQGAEGAGPDNPRIESGQRWVTRWQAERVPEVVGQRYIELERLDLQL